MADSVNWMPTIDKPFRCAKHPLQVMELPSRCAFVDQANTASDFEALKCSDVEADGKDASNSDANGVGNLAVANDLGRNQMKQIDARCLWVLDHLQTWAYHNGKSFTKGLVPVTNRLNQLASLLQSPDDSSGAMLEADLAKAGQVPVEISRQNVEDSSISDEESQALRQEKLDAIKAAIARGDYDSDDLLDKAMSRMLERLRMDDVK
jgi:anti-sigma28 factor (negative regulator of flagellin synthesis)